MVEIEESQKKGPKIKKEEKREKSTILQIYLSSS